MIELTATFPIRDLAAKYWFPVVGVVGLACYRMRHRPNFLWGLACAGIAVGVLGGFVVSQVGWDRLYFNLVESQLRRDAQWVVGLRTVPPLSLRSVVARR